MPKPLKLAFTSGKGGVGKTTFATSLAVALADNGQDCIYIDCDVEAPNGHLFLKPAFSREEVVNVPIAAVDPALCDACGICVEACQYNALALIKDNLMVFEQLCHGCGGCMRLCPQNALSEKMNPIGTLQSGTGRDGIFCMQGLLKISEPMASPVIHQLKAAAEKETNDTFIYDSPPGASCSVVETLREMDFAWLVTEPTPFGLHDLKQILGVVRSLILAHAVIIRRTGLGGDNQMDAFLTENNIPVALRVPYDTDIAHAVSSGGTLLEANPLYKNQLIKMLADTGLKEG